MNIKGEFVTLRAMTGEDMPLIVEMFNDPEIESLVVGWAFPLSLEQQNRWFENHINDKNDLRFIIETEEDGAVGILALTEIDWKNRSATHGIKICAKQNRQKGIGTDALMASMRYVFDELGLQRLDASWLEYNHASRSLYKKCGWTEEGVLRKRIYKGGAWHNLIVGGILAEDYRKLLDRDGGRKE